MDWIASDVALVAFATATLLEGGGVAGLVHTGTALLRLKSSTLTAGAVNPAMAAAELMGAVALSLLAPLPAAAVAAILLVVLMRLLGHRVRKRRLAGMV